MSFVGTGDGDWVELDFDLFDLTQVSTVESIIDNNYEALSEAIGADFEIEKAEDGLMFLTVKRQRRYRAEVDRAGRLLLTVVLDPDGPL